MKCTLNREPEQKNVPNRTMGELRAGEGEPGLWKATDRGLNYLSYVVIPKVTAHAGCPVLCVSTSSGKILDSGLHDSYTMEYIGPVRITIDMEES